MAETVVKVICSWCLRLIKEVTWDTTNDDPSHGICDDCLLEYFPHHYDAIKAHQEVTNA